MARTKRTLLAAQHGSLFFLKYPDAMKGFEEKLKAGGIAGVFHEAKTDLEREWNEKESASDDKQQTKSAIRLLTRSLLRDARDLEDVINSLLRLSDEPEEKEISLLRTDNVIADYDNFTHQLNQLKDFITEHGKLSEKVQNFEVELGTYKENLGKIGDVTELANTEHKEAYAALEQAHPFLSAANAATREFLRQTNPELREEFLGKKKAKKSSEDGASQD